MKRFFYPVLALSVLMFPSCNRTPENNCGLDYESLEVIFSATVNGGEWAAGDVAGIFATCTRNETENTPMSENAPARFMPLADGPVSYLVKTDDDNSIVSLASDHNFKFYAYAPYDESQTDLTKLSANVPAKAEMGKDIDILYVAKRSATSVVAPVELTFGSISALVKVKIPDDIVAENNTVLKKAVIRPADPDSFTGSLAYDATYDLREDKITVVPGTERREIEIDFGENGYEMASGYTPVNFLMAPFTVPENGFSIEFTDIEGNTNTVPFLNNEAGKEYGAGSVIEKTLSSSSDGIVPCYSPVEWPIGYKDGVGVFSNTTQPLWLSEHIWTASQPQATMQYVISPDHPTMGSVIFETNNFVQYNYSAGCVKGSWTGDCFEFDVPVRKFKAGTTVTMTIPSYGRGNPLFWDFEYLDGEEWKCDRQSRTSPDGQFTKDCSLMIEHGNKNGSFEGIVYEVKMLFENEIPSGHIRIRMKVAYGQYITNPSATFSNSCTEVSAPRLDGSSLFAFVNMSGKINSLKIEW